MTRSVLGWQPSAHQRRLLTVTVAALLAALLLGRGELVALAAPAIWLLVAGRSRPGAHTLDVHVYLDIERCFEGDEVAVRFTVAADGPLDQIDVRLLLPAGMFLVEGEPDQTHLGVDALDLTWTVRPERWGRWPVGWVRVVTRGGGRLLEAEVTCPVGEVAVFPHAPALRVAPAPARLPDRVGDHASRTVGEGVEFSGVRPYVWGDRPRRINWPATARRHDLYVTQLAAERACDVVVCVDAFADVGEPGTSSLDLAVRGAAGVVRSYLRYHDRVGMIALGGILRWIGSDIGERQFYRIVESVLDVQRGDSVVHPEIGRVPRTALPPGALIVMFSPLLDERALEVARDLRERGFSLVVVDVLGAEPHPDPKAVIPQLALRLWRLDRRALRLSLADLGVTVLTWDGHEPLDVPFGMLALRRSSA